MLGWNTITFYLGTTALDSTEKNRIVYVSSLDGYRDSTVVQCVRLLAGNYIDEGIVMTSDIDMIPLKNYWKPEPNRITIYGMDLVGPKEVPMCYVAAPVGTWVEMFPEIGIVDLLDKIPEAKSDDFQKYWFVDQHLLYDRLNDCDMGIRNVQRTHNSGLAYGRVDRADWERTITMPGEKIDAHMPRPFSLEQTERIMKMIVA